MSDRRVLQVRLVSLDDSDGIPQRRVVLAAGQDVIVGRASANRGVAASADNTKINNPVISKEHAVLTLDPAGTTVLIKDLRSMHGTRVDGQELALGEQRALVPGSTLQFGSSVIRGNATFKPACYVFHFESVNPTSASSSTMPTPAPVPQSQAFSDTKKGYGDDSSMYSDDLGMEDEDFASEHEPADVTLVADPYSSEHESEVSREGSAETSSDGSTNEFGDCDSRSVENCCSTDPACLATDAVFETDAKPDSFYAYQRESFVVGSGTSSVQASDPAIDIDSEMATGEWQDCSEADQSTFFASASAAWAPEAPDNFNFNMDTDDHNSANELKARPFSNSINDLCEPVPKVEDNVGDGSAAAATATVNLGPAPEPPLDASVGCDKVMMDVDHLVDDCESSTGLAGGSKSGQAGTKRSADEAELDVEPTSESTTTVKAEQIATPEQLSGRRMASFTRRARDIGIGAVVGGVAMLTVLARMGDPA